MAITVKHKYVSAIPDAGDTSVVQPSNWNDDHDLVGTIPVANGGTGASTLTGYVKGNGTSTMTAASTIPNTDITGLGTASTKDSGVANGVATLDGTGKVPVSELPAAVLGALSYQGTWDASTNTPTLTSSVGTKGYYYVVSVAGSTNLNGITDWQVGDWAVYNGSIWQKVDNTDAGGDVVGPASATDNAITRFDGTTGRVIQNSVVTVSDTGAIAGAISLSDPNFVDFNTSYTTPVTQGQLGWDGTFNSLTIGMVGNNVIQHIGEDTYIYVKASSAITKGQVCMFTGSVGASGVVTADPATGVTNGQVIIGVAAETIALNGFGLIQTFGELRNVNTSAFADGDILYYNSAVTGGFTTTFPVSGPIVTVAAVINGGSAGGGVITIRVSVTQRLTASTGISVSQTSVGTTITNTLPSLGGTVTSVSGTAGRITSTGGTTPVIDLASGVATAGTTGSSSLIPVVTIDTYGRVTGITTAANPQGTVTSVTGTSPVVSSGGATPAISMPAATTSVDGYLTSTDWNTFNGKGSGTVTSITAGTGLTGGAITTSGTVALANTAVTAGTYTTADITVDAQGRITAAANGSAGGMVYPGAGIPNSTGTSWGTSYTTTGTGTVVALAGDPTFTGITTVAAGTAALPSLVTASSSTTGLFSSTANQLGVSVSGVSKGVFTSTGLNAMAIGATTASTGAFTTLNASGVVNFSTTGAITIGSSVISGGVTVGSSTATNTVTVSGGNHSSGATKTLNLATTTAGGTGTTNINIGDTTNTTGTVNGTFNFTGSLSAVAVGNGGVFARNAGQTANVSILNQATFTTGGITLPTQTAAAGSVWRIRAYGQFTAVSNATARTAQVACFWGSTQLTAITPSVLTSNAQTTQWQCEFTLSASSTTAIWTAGTMLNRVASLTALDINNATPASTTVTSGAQTLDLRFRVSTAVAAEGWTIQSVTMERLE
jgi:hypothetical protein